jgi:hypothetical protein
MVHISALERFLPEKSASPAGERYMATNLSKVIAWIKETYEHPAGGACVPGRSELRQGKPTFELPVVDWNGKRITSDCTRVEYLRELLDRQ